MLIILIQTKTTMNIVQIDGKSVTLEGISLNATLRITNPHEMLAVIFQVESNPNILDIEPERGIIMQGDRKVIKIKLKPVLRESALQIQKQQNLLILKVSYFCEYNKKMMEKNQMRGWSQISKKSQETRLPIFLNFQKQIQKVRSSIKRETSLQNSRKMNSFQKFRESSIKKTKNSKLNQDLDSMISKEQFKNKISPHNSNNRSNHQHSSNMFELKYDMKSKTSPQLFEGFASQARNKVKPVSKILNSSIERSRQRVYQQEEKLKVTATLTPLSNKAANHSVVSQNRPTSKFIGHQQTAQATNSRAFQLIILAIVAALFVALGESTGRMLK